MSLWFSQKLNIPSALLSTVSADASFRRYFRYQNNDSDYILVDAPPATEKNQEFIDYAVQYAKAGLDVPRVIWGDTKQGFLCLTDLGNQTLFPLLENNATQWYPEAVRLLPLLSKVTPLIKQSTYDAAFFQQELSLFIQWFCNDLLQIELSTAQSNSINSCFKILINNAIEQPQVSVHRDFHSRNIMVRDNRSLSVIDFQDTVTGPLTYDAVSLLKDCYFKLSNDDREVFIKQSYDQFVISQQLTCSYDQYKKWFDLMGLQRHLKVCGIFSRLHFRDNKSHYLNDLPLVIDYIVDILDVYEELSPLKSLFEKSVLPIVQERINTCLP